MQQHKLTIICIGLMFALFSCSKSNRFFVRNGNEKDKLWVRVSEVGDYEIIAYNNGVKHGEYLVYYPSGILKIKGRYRNGIECGKWKYYDELGRLERIIGHNKTGERYIVEQYNLIW